MTKVMMKGFLAVACALLTLTAAVRAEEGSKPQPFLVVVGVSNYQDKAILPRVHAEDDAKALFDLYTNKEYYGVDKDHARLLLGTEDAKRGSEPATRENILKAMKWIAKEAKPHDPVFVAIFGEGGPLGAIGDRHCYFASDSTLQGRDKNAVAAAEISEALKGFKGQKFAVYLDVNFKGFKAPKGKPLPEPSFSTKPFAEFRGELGSEEGIERTPGRVVFLANRPNSPSLNGPKHGIFTMALLKALKGAADTAGMEADGLVTVDELAEYLEKQIPDLAASTARPRRKRNRSPSS